MCIISSLVIYIQRMTSVGKSLNIIESQEINSLANDATRVFHFIRRPERIPNLGTFLRFGFGIGPTFGSTGRAYAETWFEGVHI